MNGQKSFKMSWANASSDDALAHNIFNDFDHSYKYYMKMFLNCIEKCHTLSRFRMFEPKHPKIKLYLINLAYLYLIIGILRFMKMYRKIQIFICKVA